MVIPIELVNKIEQMKQENHDLKILVAELKKELEFQKDLSETYLDCIIHLTEELDSK